MSYPKNKQWPNLVELLRWRVEYQPDQQAYTFLADGEIEAGYLTYAQLDQQARWIGAKLQQLKATGEPILLLYPAGLEFLTAFLGCLYAGAVPVPTTHAFRRNLSNARLEAITRNAQAKVGLTDQAILGKIQQHSSPLSHLQWVATDQLEENLADKWTQPNLDLDSLALLQYTSGSTARPKGVMITHRNLMNNLAFIHQRFEVSEADCGVIWLPPYHDMGLIGGYLQPLFGGFPVVLMPPLAFGEQPLRWLKAMSRYRGTISGGPNFAYEQCLRRIGPEQRDTLDLSHWRVAFVGAEPIHYQTLAQFATIFTTTGFKREALYPCYGLAESTLMVTGGLAEALPVTQIVQTSALQSHQFTPSSSNNDAQILVGCGQIADDHTLLIVDPVNRTPCPDGQIGEIWLSGPSVTQGYWQNTYETEQVFGSLPFRDNGVNASSQFLRTGDLGFVHEGELFITGRLKEIIIIRGLNYYPQDIEQVVEQSHPALVSNSGAAFSVEIDGQERLIFVAEVDRHHRNVEIEAVATAIRQAVTDSFGLETYTVVLIKPGQLPRTTSGKIQRLLCRERFLADSLLIIGQSVQSPSPQPSPQGIGSKTSSSRTIAIHKQQYHKIASTVRLQLAELLETQFDQIDLQQSIQTLGIGSLQAAALKFQLEDEFGVDVAPEMFFKEQTLDQFIGQLVILVQGQDREEENEFTTTHS